MKEVPQTLADDRDRLTGLLGTESVRTKMAEWQTVASSTGAAAPVHAMMLGLRRFDTVNLAFGEAAGDSALVAVATRLLHFADKEFEGESIVARMGGGHFLILAHESCSRERWQWLAETLAEIVAKPIQTPSGGGMMRLSPRMALMRLLKDEGPEAMFERLAETLERAQMQPSRRILWVDGDVTVPGRSSAQLEADLLAALDRDEIEILYQPQYSAEDDALVGAEALARWQHPELGRLSAGALFAIADRAEYVAQLSRHIAERALAGAVDWPDSLRLSLNITPADLSVLNFADQIAGIVAETGFDADRLTLEITEQALLTDIDRSADALGKLVELGMRIALDDFGAGFCNFRYLKLLPLHYLKLDRTMLDDIVNDSRDLAVFRGIVAMAQALDLSVIAEGVENESQRAAIAAEGCSTYQGFLKARPMEASAFLQLAKG